MNEVRVCESKRTIRVKNSLPVGSAVLIVNKKLSGRFETKEKERKKRGERRKKGSKYIEKWAKKLALGKKPNVSGRYDPKLRGDCSALERQG